MYRSLLLAGLGVLALAGVRVLAAPPAPAATTPLTAETLPATKSDGDLELTLSRLTTGLPPPANFRPEPGEETFTRMNLRLHWGDRKASVWRVDRILLTDSEGHPFTPHHVSLFLDGKGEGNITVSGPAAWAVNAPWKIHLELARTSPTPDYEFWKEFGPDELVTIPRVRVPEQGETTPARAAGNAQGASVQILGLAGPHTRMPGGVPLNDAYPSIHFRYQAPERNVHVTFLRATDAAGAVIPRGSSAMGVGPEGTMYAHGLKVPPGVREVYLAFAVHRNRVFDFTVLPTVE